MDFQNEYSKVALIPAYKPLPLLAELVRQLYDEGLRVVLVDDGSGEEYLSIFERCAEYADICRHAENAGKGRALKTGLSYIYEKFGSEVTVVTVDADGQHTLKDALAVCASASEAQGALVLGSRHFIGDVPFRSRFGNKITRVVFLLSSGVRLRDTQTGLRAFGGGLIPTLIDIPGERYEYEINMLLELSKRGVPIIEHGIDTVYENNNESSHFKPVRDSLRIYGQILKFSASSLIGFAVDYIMYALLWFFSNSLTFSNVGARVISATVNFLLNRKFVFKDKGSVWVSALKYTALALAILVGNTLCLNLLVDICGVSELLAKLLTECVFFMLSWLIQKKFVFRKKGDNK